MLTVRPYIASDLDAVRELYKRQGSLYDLPDLEKPEFLVRAVIENGNGVEMCLLLRKTAETYLLFDPKTSRRETIGRIMAMTKECQPAAKRAGFTDVHAWIPPEVDTKQFQGLLAKLGWIREPWVSYVKAISL